MLMPVILKAALKEKGGPPKAYFLNPLLFDGICIPLLLCLSSESPDGGIF